jgi:hypothetical protein
MENNKTVTSMSELTKEADKPLKTGEEILKLMQDYFTKNSDNIENIIENTRLHDTGGDLKNDEIGRNKVIFKMIKRFCKVHASYVLKEMPNIKITAKNQEVPESNQLAASVQKGLLLWWKEQSMLRKIKRQVRKAAYKGLVAFYLSNDKKNETFTFNTIDPEMMAYDTISDSPDSELLWFAHGEMIDVGILQKSFPKVKNINPLRSSKFFSLTSKINAYFKNINFDNKAFYFEFIDSKRRYKFINDEMVGHEEHNYPFIPYYVFPYFDFDSETITSLVDFIKEPAKMINQIFGYRLDFTERHSDPPLVVRGGADKGKLDPNKIKGGIIEVTGDGSAQFIGPAASSIDAEKMIELVKTFMHFLSGLSEEAMAGFTGSLTAAGVSIELRLDATVREALDTQIILQDVLQKINRDYLRLMEKTYPEKNMLESSLLGVDSDRKFEAKLIAGLYNNTIDFGGILPRSQDQIVRNTVTKFSTGLISSKTALMEMNYSDPELELAKIKMEQIADGKLKKQLEAGLTPDEKFFATAEMENAYMFEKGEMATVAPDQDHELHIAIHESVLEKLSASAKSLFALHIQMHRQMMTNIQNS